MSCQKTRRIKNNKNPLFKKKQGAKPLQAVRRSYGEILAGYDQKMKGILERMAEGLEVSV